MFPGQPTKLPALERKTPLRTSRALIALAVAVTLVATGVVSATAQAPTTPRDPAKPCPGTATPPACGEHYLFTAGITLQRISSTLLGFPDSVDTSKSTTQTDLFKPGGTRAGPPEPTSCNGAGYGKTVWYDLNPTVDGDVLVQAVGASSTPVIFNPVISLVRYDVRDRPNFRPLGRFRCSNLEAGPREQLQQKGVKRGRGYSIQIGGVGNTGGPLDVDVNFTPYRVQAEPKLAFQLTPEGVKLVSVRVSASRKSRVEVRCAGCGKRVKRGRRAKFNFGGKALRAGSRITIRVTRGGEIGAYFVRKIRRGRAPTETKRCLNPGSRKPRKTCP